MKNILTIFAFLGTMFMGIQSTSAQALSQDKSRPEVIAKADTEKLTTALDLTGDQGRAVFRALVAKEVSYQKKVDNKDSKDASVIAEKKKIDSQLNDSMKKILSAEQYKKWAASN